MKAEHLQFVEKVNETRFKDPLSRRNFMKGVVATGAGAAGLAAIAGGTASNAFAASSSDVNDINIAVTAEALAVTYLGAVINGAYQNATGNDAAVKTILQAAQYEEYVHYKVLTSLGAKPLTTTFTVPASADPSDKAKALATIEVAEGLFVAAYLAAVGDFANEGNWKYAQVAAEIMGVEAQHLAFARFAQNESPANNLSFMIVGTGVNGGKTPVSSVADAATQLKALGFIGGTGTQVQFSNTAVPSPPGQDAAADSPTNATPVSSTSAGSPGMPNTGAMPLAGAGLLPLGIGGVALGGATAALVGMLRRRGDLG
ncbi:MAG: ferritin-like domain-containing protein [Candidatus Dormibacteraceae bacterium]